MSALDVIERLAKTAPVSTWALFGAGIASSVLQVGVVLVLWLGNWPAVVVKDQIMFVGIIAIIQALSSLAVVTSLSKTRLAAKGPGSFSFDVSADSSAPTTTTTTTTSPGKP